MQLNAQNFALHFDGQDDEVILGNSTLFDIGISYTLEAWINATEWRQEQWQGTILGKDTPNNGDQGYAFRCGKEGTLSFVMSVNGNWNEVATGPIMDAGVWNHVAAVIDDGEMRLYVNGSEEASAGYNGTPSMTQFANLKIGASAEFSGRIFHGAIDEVRLWNIARTEQELNEFKSETLSGTEAGLISYYEFNEGTGVVLGNKVGSAPDGSLTNMTEESWIGGVAISAIDVGVTDIVNPDVVTIFNRPVRVGVNLKNFGTEPIKDIKLKLMVDGNEIHQETITETIAEGSTDFYLFKKAIDFSQVDQQSISVISEHPDDANTANNMAELQFEKQTNPNLISIFDARQHNFANAGQTQFKAVNLPEDLQIYEQIIMHVSLECPAGGCDPWDQPANIFLVKDGEEYELGRYITPYGIACGNWTVDITDFKSLLGGSSAFKSYIQVWGASGWLLNLDLELIEGAGSPSFNRVGKLWENQYLVYGDPSISHNLPVLAHDIDINTESTHLRLTISGHGQGNTDNAAEFSPKTHEIVANNFTVNEHFLWKNDCAVNTCANQAGNWTINRAGWCPGEAVAPYIYNLTPHFNPGATGFLDYKLQNYVNLMNTGYNGTSHTEPHYRLASYVVENSPVRYESYDNLNLSEIVLDIDSTSSPMTFGPVSLRLLNEGSEIIENPTVRYFVNGILVAEELVEVSITPGQTHHYDFKTNLDFIENVAYNIVANIQSPDDNPNDDYNHKMLQGALTNIEALNLDHLVELFPNPSKGSFNLKVDPSLTIHDFMIYDSQGQVIFNRQNVENLDEIYVPNQGVYVLLMRDVNGNVYRKKLLVIN